MRRKIKFVDTGLDVPVVAFYFRQKKYYAILDTGSECTLFDKDFVKENKDDIEINMDSDDKDIIMYATKQSMKPVTAKTTISFVSDENILRVVNHIPVDGIVFNMSEINEYVWQASGIKVSAVIGSDILNKYKMKLDFKDKSLLI